MEILSFSANQGNLENTGTQRKKKVLQTTPWKINMEPSNHQLRKENDLANFHDYVPC